MKDNQFGQEITRLRKRLNLTQKELCESICTQPTISMIEKGEIIPGVEILDALSSKLKVPTTYLIDLLITDDYAYTRNLMYEIEDLTLKQKFNTVYEITCHELEKYPEDPWVQLFLNWQFYLSAYHVKKLSINEAIVNIKTLLTTVPSKILNVNHLIDRINNTIANLYSTKGDFNSALYYYNKININSIFPDSSRLDPTIYHIRVIYNKTKTLYDMGNYQEAILSCKKGIAISIERENMSLLGNFYYYLGQCYEQQNFEIEQVKNCYKNALFFFKLLNRHLYIQIIQTEKLNFLT